MELTPEELRAKFCELKNPVDVAELLDIEKARLNYYLYIYPPNRRYKKFFIPKRSGGLREINAPATALQIVQAKLNQVLQVVYRPRPSVHSFIAKNSIATNARVHSGRNYVFNVDLADFFPSITFPRVRGMFIAKPYQLPPSVATVLAQICCHNNILPQGAPTSPIISNMLCAKMDNELGRLARKYRCRYTRYADDLTFSTDSEYFPDALAKYDSKGILRAGEELKKVISDNGFTIAIKKLRLRRSNVRQQVTGLIVNKGVNVLLLNLRWWYNTLKKLRGLLLWLFGEPLKRICKAHFQDWILCWLGSLFSYGSQITRGDTQSWMVSRICCSCVYQNGIGHNGNLSLVERGI